MQKVVGPRRSKRLADRQDLLPKRLRTVPIASLSPLELLPEELKWMLIEYAPGSVFDLRLVSRTIKQSVDSCALHTSCPIVDKIRIFKKNYYNELMLYWTIKNSKAALFDLRRHLKTPFGKTSFNTARIMRTCCYRDIFAYNVFTGKDDPKTLDFIRDLIGSRVNMISIEDNYCSRDLGIIKKCLNRIKFRRLQTKNVEITNEYVSFIRETIASNEVDSLEFRIGKICLSNPRIPISSRYFFGLIDFDLSSIFLEMFSNKLDKLSIVNICYAQYLTNNCAEVLKNRLPLLKKKIWFQATCKQFSNIFKYMINNYSVEGFSSDAYYSDLRVVHSSREHENITY